MTTCVSSSSSQYSSRSLDETSALLPMETNAENPSPRTLAASSSASPRAPLWDAKPIGPRGNDSRANVALTLAAATASPRQFGPSRRAPWERTSASSRSCRSAPLLPTSAKPAVNTQRARVPCSSASRATSSTPAAGTQITARSTGSGSSAVERTAATPPTACPRSVHRVGAPGEATLDEIAEHRGPDRSGPGRRADHGNALGSEERLERRDDALVVAAVDVLAVALGRRDREHAPRPSRPRASASRRSRHPRRRRAWRGSRPGPPPRSSRCRPTRPWRRAARAAACRRPSPAARPRPRTRPPPSPDRGGAPSWRRATIRSSPSSERRPTNVSRSTPSGSRNGATSGGPTEGTP